MEPVELRPLSLGELLDRTFTLYRSRFWLFAGIMAIPAAFSVPFNVVYISARGNPLFVQGMQTFTSGAVALLLIFGLVLFIAYVLAVGAATCAVSESYLGRDTTVRGSYGKIGGRFWKILGVSVNVLARFLGLMFLAVVAASMMVGGGAVLIRAVAPSTWPGRIAAIVITVLLVVAFLCALVLPFIFTLRYAVAIPALLLERLGAFASIRRSVQLTAGRRWHLFLAFLLTTTVSYVGVVIFQGPFFAFMMFSRSGPLPSWLAFGSSVAGAVGGTITGPLLMIVLVLCYYDSRIRREGFDLQHMMATLDAPAPAGTVTPA